ncbi:tRNA lysidine(34) synthetase TilS [Arcobacter sp. HD9-500m-PIT-SAG03]|nr:tRNA lysidine(34) synthetase TilS [Arcobacter sp. HD9-500m-PIT-SAG03]
MILSTSFLHNKKNLLAFSAGVDSTALFFLLLEKNISFDIAIVNYNMREQSKEEVSYAQKLALRYDKACFIKEVELDTSNFEKNARDVRYAYFEELISNYSYDNLITAHQLNDKLEWFLMQFTKGAGLVELVGLTECVKKDNYNLIRPILDCSKDTLVNYLKINNIKYFVDESNFNEKYKRNYFRKSFANKLLNEFENGIKKSFDYLNKDVHSLQSNEIRIVKIHQLEVFQSSEDDNKSIRIIDKSLKKRGYILSSSQRNEIIRQREIIIDKFAISIIGNNVWISPKSLVSMDKKFKELCRISKIPKKNRAYLKEAKINLKEICSLLK